MSYDSLLIHTCYIGTETTSTNEFGELKPSSWSYSSTGTLCRFSPLTLREQSEIGGKYENISYRVFFKSGASVTLGGRIRYNSEDYLIRERYYDSSGHHITCLLEKI